MEVKGPSGAGLGSVLVFLLSLFTSHYMGTIDPAESQV